MSLRYRSYRSVLQRSNSVAMWERHQLWVINQGGRQTHHCRDAKFNISIMLAKSEKCLKEVQSKQSKNPTTLDLNDKEKKLIFTFEKLWERKLWLFSRPLVNHYNSTDCWSTKQTDGIILTQSRTRWLSSPITQLHKGCIACLFPCVTQYAVPFSYMTKMTGVW